MKLLEIIKEPSQLLRKISRPLRFDEINDDLRSHISNMAVTMYANKGVGLAGPQVKDFRRILVADIGYVETLDPDQYGRKLIKMINPTVTISSQDTGISMEGCLSIPDFEQEVERSKKITVSYLDEWGISKEEVFKDFSAVVIQHEIDHLNGITLYSRATKLSRKSYLKRVKNG